MSTTWTPTKPDWANLEVLHKNTLPPRSHFYPFTSKTDALTYDSANAQSILLNGEWKFKFSESPFEAPEGLSASATDLSSWDEIHVPGMWQLQGYGRPQYVNLQYPFPVDPPNPPYEHNQTGSYVRKFEIPKALVDQELRLRFEGVDAAFHVYLNGKEVGYSQGSRNPSEFDITKLVNRLESNILGVRVYQYCDGSYIEDQDQWRMSGIYRDVRLIAFPKKHIKDFHVQTILDDQYKDATLSLSVEVEGDDTVTIEVLDAASNTVVNASKRSENGKTKFELPIKNPQKWTAETPYLYHLVIAFGDQVTAQRIGFRRIEIKNGVYLVNGNKVVFRGANRHEHHPLHGRAVPYEFMKNDLLIMKKHNINALRTCHQPSDPRVYDLCDELGIWVLDEADLECHGFFLVEEMAMPDEQKLNPHLDRKALLNKTCGKWTSDNPDWEEAYVDRARALVSRDKNHACVIMWSLGNEAFYGRNFQAMYDWIKRQDETRPIHYEGDLEAESVDVFSQMYPSVADIIAYAERTDITKPLVLCEYIHAMGNGPGNIKEYVDAFYKYPHLMGGFEWEWANHGLKTTSKEGEVFYGYGGDFGDQPNDYDFVMDGMLYSDHTPNRGLTEYAKAIEPVQVLESDDRTFTIINRYDFVSLDHLRCKYWFVWDGNSKPGGEVTIPAGILPGKTAKLEIPPPDDDIPNREAYLDLTFYLADATTWAEAGHVVGTGQIQLKEPMPYVSDVSCDELEVTTLTTTSIQISSAQSLWAFDTARGILRSWRKNNVELIHDGRGPQFDIYRAPTENDSPQDGAEWREKMVHLAKSDVRSVSYPRDMQDKGKARQQILTIVVNSRFAPPVLSWCLNVTTTYTFQGSGLLTINCQGSPAGVNLPKTLPRLGLIMALPSEYDQVKWFGRGPLESYSDKKLSQLYGNWSSSVSDTWMPYEFPQESGNRTDVRWVELSLSSPSSPASPTLKVHFGTQPNFSFQYSCYETADVDAAQHPFELERLKREYVILRLDARHHGLGTGSCGPKTLEEYALKTASFKFEVLLE